ncbi:MAG: hypothetical protein BHV77_03885 [Bacteroides sp. 43_108]|nr:MAG: hypothetical protein BHV77_03885 [Bacteroides sp. 43_108]
MIMNNYKPTYTKEEVDELVKWFNEHEYDDEVDLGHGQYIKSVKVSVAQLSHLAQLYYANRNFSGPINMLFKIRDCLTEQGKVHE